MAETVILGAMRRRFRPLYLPGLALAAILLVGLATNIAALVSGDGPRAGNDLSWRAVLAGEPMAALGRYLLHENPLADALVTADRVVAWNTVGDLGTRVRRGCGNWLFLTDELRLYPHPEESMAGRLGIVRQVAAFLARRHIALVVALVPDKSRVEAAHLCGVDRPAALAERYARTTTAFQVSAVRIRTVDLLAPLAALDGERYYRTDTHWNERGAKAAADAIADSLRRDGLAPTPGEVDFRVAAGKQRERVGDLIRLAGLDRVPLPLRPRGDIVAESTIEEVAKPGTGILDEVPAPQVAVIGTSFSRRANFTNFLALSLTAPVADKAEDGASLTSAAIAYFADPAFTAAPPHVIVWEIPERIVEEPVAASDTVWAEKLAGGHLGEGR